MKLEFHGGAGEVTGSHHVLDTGTARIGIDAGLFQGSRQLDELNRRGFGHDVCRLGAMLLTHSHIDHSGRLPLLVKMGYGGEIFSTPASADLCDLMFRDSARLMREESERDTERDGDLRPPRPPLYTEEDAVVAMKRFRPAGYGQTIDVAGLKVRWSDAGHILGSAILEIQIGQKTLVMSGDLGRPNAPILRDPQKIDAADYLVIESTYGDREHEDKGNRSERLFNIVRETIGGGGNVIIPAFAVGRTQELLYELNPYFESGKLPRVKTFIDSPMAISASEIYKRHPECFDAQTNQLLSGGDQPLEFGGLEYTRTKDQSKAINLLREPHIVLSANGMCSGGRILYHVMQNISRPESTLLFVGYMAEGTLGRQLRDGVKYVKIMGREFDVRARIEIMDSYSAHADQSELLEWVGAFKRLPKRAFVVHGEGTGATVLAQELRRRYKMDVSIPAIGDSFELR